MISIKFSNLPLLNLRMEYEGYRRRLADPEFRRVLNGKTRDELHCGTFVWATKDQGASVMLQRVVLGLEARIPVAVSLELMCQGRHTKKLADPFSLGSKSVPDCYYNRMPALIEPRFALRQANPQLWELVRTFYGGIRNKIFHGYYITDLTAEKLDYVFSVFDQVHAWSDSWCNIMERLNEIGRSKHARPTVASHQ